MSQYKHPFLAVAEGTPVEPFSGQPDSPSSPTPPHTTVEKAALCDSLLPFLAGFRETIHAAAMKQPQAPAGDEAVAMAQALLGDVPSLLCGERMGHYVGRLTIVARARCRPGLAVNLPDHGTVPPPLCAPAVQRRRLRRPALPDVPPAHATYAAFLR